MDFLRGQNKKDGKRGKNGVTVIVGPNGSGKSNVSDAIRWVMGEQSMKSLRGKKSEDIIFSGSHKKGRLGAASVTMHFDNSDKRIPLEYNEVSITRKVTKDGEGEYLINGSRVRLMDVIDLLAAAGVGKESHCVVNQGMTDATLGAAPLERRTMIEDAAGVKQFQIKKDRALRKMESTRANLQRVRELTVEIEPHLKSLARQAKKAQEGREVYETLKEQQRLYFSYIWHTLKEERVQITEQTNSIGIEMKNMQRDVDKINDAIIAESQKVEKANAVGGFEEEKKVLYQKLTQQEKNFAVAQGRIDIERERIAAEKAVKRVLVDLDYVQGQVAKIQKAQEDILSALEKAQNMEEVTAIITQANTVRDQIAKLYEDAGEKEVDVHNDYNQEVIAGFEKNIVAQEDIVVRTQKEIESAKNKIAALDAQIKEAISEDHKARQEFFALEKGLRGKQDALSVVREKHNEAKIALARVEVREEDVQAECRDELHMDITELSYDASEPSESGEEAGGNVDREALEKEISKLKGKYEHIGGIDPMVVEEYEETQERFTVLHDESKDLESAIVSLKEIVKEMDVKIDKEFAKAYTHVNKEFARYFRIIFAGGSAHLSKVKVPVKRSGEAIEEEVVEQGAEGSDGGDSGDEENTDAPGKYEIGIEISAHPPGKKVKHLSLLSGGERSLTSIALLFAIISYNPPPFAVLDEVEAALDEANSQRFGRILQDLSDDTQFVIITHNRETMRQADLLYGVTMGDDGISKLLSVRLDQIGLENKDVEKK